jgi:hypothetical protein
VFVAGRTVRRERKWTRSELVFLRRGGGFDSIGVTDLPPHLRRECRKRIGTPNPQILAFCNLIATVCELSVTISAVSPHLKQSATDCNMPGSEDSPQTAQNPVVEHKGWDASFDFSWSLG